MKLVTLKTSKTFKANQTNIIAIAGEVTFNENAEIQVEESLVDQLIAIMPEFSRIGGEEEGEDIKKKSEENEELGKSDTPDIKPQVEENNISGSVESKQVESITPPLPPTKKVEVIGEEEKKEEHTGPSKEEILEKLQATSYPELKKLVNSYPKELTDNLGQKKDDFVQFLLEQLTK